MRYRIFYENISISISHICNWNCPNCSAMCSNKQAPDKKSPFEHIEDIRRCFDMLYRNCMGWRRLELSGGEPTLHPDFDLVLDAARQYHNKTGAAIRLMTNGSTKRVRSMHRNDELHWLNVSDSTGKGKHACVLPHQTVNDAPEDDIAYRNSDYSMGCRWLRFGLGFYGNKYYACAGVMANIDRIYSLDIGITNIYEVNEHNLREQMRQACRYCGIFKKNISRSFVQVSSSSWRKAFDAYKRSL